MERPSAKPSSARITLRGLLKSRFWLLTAVGSVGVGAILLLALFIGAIPLPPAPQSSKVLATDGQVIASLHAEQDRTLVPLAAISPALQKAVIATEDRSFYTHRGVSVRGIGRAIAVALQGGEIAQGGSTITQQYVRNAFAQVGRKRTIFRKLKEIAFALKVERRYSKDKILESYLNTIYYGRGAYGAEAAARTYFKKPAKDLTLTEAAYLAGIIRAPERFQDPEAGTRIRNEVLGDMVKAGLLSATESEQARREPLSVEQATLEPVRAAFFVEYVRRLLKDEHHLSDAEILGGGLEISTTLDLRAQEAAEKAISSTLDQPKDPEAALVAMDPEGRIRAMVGGREFQDRARAQGFNFAWQKAGKTGGRQPGSAFKPLTLAAFVEQGHPIDSQFPAPGSIEIESPQCRDVEGENWKVENFDGEAYGRLSVRDATAKSVNTVYAQMVDQLRPSTVATLARRVGGWDDEVIPPVCSLALGTPAVSPLEMARAFATFAGRGNRPDVLAVTKIAAPGGRVLAERSPQRDQVLDENVADTVNLVLQDVILQGTARGRGIGRPAAGKTGTTQNHVDAWFVGYTPDLVGVVWMGFPPDPSTGTVPQMTDVRGRRVTGGSFPATIWQKFMTDALRGTRPTPFHDPRTQATFDPARTASPPPAPTFSPTPFSEEEIPIFEVPSPLPLAPPPRTRPVESPRARPSPTPSPRPTPTPSPTASPSPSGPSGTTGSPSPPP